MSQIQEILAEHVQDEVWAGWMRYMFAHGTFNYDGSWTMHKDKVVQWGKKMNASYAELSESERRSSLIEADKILALLHRHPKLISAPSVVNE